MMRQASCRVLQGSEQHIRRFFRKKTAFSASSFQETRVLGRLIQSDASVVIDDIPKHNSPKKCQRLPRMLGNYREFPTPSSQASTKRLATARIVRMAIQRVLEPPTLHLLAASACATLGIAAVEGSLLCTEWPIHSWEACQFVLRYSVEQLFPSVVWVTQDAKLVAASMGLDPATVLQDLSGEDVRSANILLFTNLLSTSRYFFAGFMMIAQLIRAANVSMEAFDEFEDRIRNGREPPLAVENGLVVRFCGRDSHVSEVSLKKMGLNFFPVFENPDRVKFLVWKHSERKRRPVYWCVQSGLYGSAYSWDRFPAYPNCFLPGLNKHDNVLVLEADATNGNDPLTLGEKAMDLTIEDASQGFRRILERYAGKGLLRGRDFRTLRVYLGNSMETSQTGGGHLYTLRHRIHYAKEMDVLIDSRAAVLHKILEWCKTVASRDRKIFFQTSSRDYFLNLQKLLNEYGYEIYDPLDLRMINKLPTRRDAEHVERTQEKTLLSILVRDRDYLDETWGDHKEFLKGLMFDENGSGHGDTLRKVAKMSKLPRLVHMKTTAETVNAVDALIMAGEVEASNCCALIDREEGVVSLEQTLKQKEDYVQTNDKMWMKRSGLENMSTDDVSERSHGRSGLQIICSSSIHDDVLREVRFWARCGYSASEIQKEIDARYRDILHQSVNVQQEVRVSIGANETEIPSDERGEEPAEQPPDEKSDQRPST